MKGKGVFSFTEVNSRIKALEPGNRFDAKALEGETPELNSIDSVEADDIRPQIEDYVERYGIEYGSLEDALASLVEPLNEDSKVRGYFEDAEEVGKYFQMKADTPGVNQRHS